MKTSLLILPIALVLFNCKKKDTTSTTTSTGTSPTPITYPNYSQLKVGNYWVYQKYEIDTLGNATPFNAFDSCYVIKDTIIRSNTFYKVFSVNYATYINYSYQRDSLHYITNSNGTILFSSQDFNTFFYSGYQINSPSDTVFKIISKMDDKNKVITVPAGTFTTTSMKKANYYYYPYYQQYGKQIIYNTRYAQNIGIVTETIGYFTDTRTYVERRLIRYHLN